MPVGLGSCSLCQSTLYTFSPTPAQQEAGIQSNELTILFEEYFNSAIRFSLKNDSKLQRCMKESPTPLFLIFMCGCKRFLARFKLAVLLSHRLLTKATSGAKISCNED